MKNLPKIAAALAVALMMMLLVVPLAAAQEYMGEIELEAVRVGRSGIALNIISGEPYKLFDLSNMNPGDCRLVKVTFTNSYGAAVDFHMKGDDPTGDEVSGGGSLLDMLKIVIRRDAGEIYGGTGGAERSLSDMPLYDDSSRPIELGRFNNGQSGEYEIQVCLPGPETGNEYQGKNADIDFIFGVDPVSGGGGGGGGEDWYYYESEPEPPSVLPDEEIEISPEAPGVKPVMPKTGVEVPYIYYLLGGLALFGGVRLAHKPRRRK